MGFLANGICYSTSIEAADSYFSSIHPVLIKGGGSSDFYHYYSNVAGVWYLDEFQVSAGGVFSLLHHAALPLPSFASCNVSVTVFDPATFAAFWSMAMTFTLGVYLLAKNAGIILSLLKRW